MFEKKIIGEVVESVFGQQPQINRFYQDPGERASGRSFSPLEFWGPGAC